LRVAAPVGLAEASGLQIDGDQSAEAQKERVTHDTTEKAAAPRDTIPRARFTRSTLRLRSRSLRPLEEGPVNDHILRRDRVYRRALAYADTVAAAVALYLAVTVLGENDRLRPAALLALPIVIVASKLIGLYDRDELLLRKSTLEEAPALFQLATLYALVIWLLSGTFVDGELGRSQLFGLWGCLFGVTLLCRWVARGVARRAAEPERCLVLGEPATTESFCRKLEESKGLRVTVVGRMPLHVFAEQSSVAELAHTIRERRVHRAILAPGGGETDNMLDAIRLVKALGVRVSVLPRVLEVVGSSVEFDDVDGVPILGVRSFGLSRSSLRVKRATDVMGATGALVLMAPLMCVIALALRLTSPGPVFFRQVRVGRDGRRFHLLKFRSMVNDAESRKAQLLHRNESDGLFKIADDPRITRVGRLLRRTSLDEVPQLLNVLRGEMSLVGPRPLVVDEDEKIVGWHRRRLHLTPGMTGPWQILGPARASLHEMVNIDYLYVANWSFWTDVKILLRTAAYVARARSM
jgi:exopolysaccharide biosynthesis polyprenyl glycosylphosphotransferase